MPEGELRALFRACAEECTAAGARDAALIATLYGVGLRRSEVVALTLDDDDATTGKLVIRAAKGRKDRTTWATNGTADALAAWIDTRGVEPGPLFFPIRKGGRNVERRRMTAQTLRDMLLKRARQASVKLGEPQVGG